jgi:hypothetical protein
MTIFRCEGVGSVEEGINSLWGFASILFGIATGIGITLQGNKGVFYTEDDEPMTLADSPVAFWFSYMIGLSVSIGLVAAGLWIILAR